MESQRKKSRIGGKDTGRTTVLKDKAQQKPTEKGALGQRDEAKEVPVVLLLILTRACGFPNTTVP